MPLTPCPMTTDQLIAEIAGAEPDLPPEVTRRCLDLLAELVFDRTRKGVSVEVAHFGTFSPAPDGNVLFVAQD